jgi:hypothetical protein
VWRKKERRDFDVLPMRNGNLLSPCPLLKKILEERE